MQIESWKANTITNKVLILIFNICAMAKIKDYYRLNELWIYQIFKNKN